jgi:hypothetical protein
MVEAEQASRQPSAVSDTFGGLRERLIALGFVDTYLIQRSVAAMVTTAW